MPTNWLTASLAGLWTSSGLLGFNAALGPRIGDSGLSEPIFWLILTTVFVVIPLQFAVIGRQTRLVESLAHGTPFEQLLCKALMGRCLLWLITAIASGCLLEEASMAFARDLVA